MSSKRNKTKKSKYKVVANPLEGYNFSFARCHAAEIGAYIIGIGIAVLISILTVCYSEDGRGWSNLKENIIYPIICSIPLILGGLSMTLRIRKVKKIMTKGKKVEGEIVSYSRTHIQRSTARTLVKEPNYTLLNISFYHNGEQKCVVGIGNKLPEKVFASPRCMIYVFDDTVFVTEFELRKKGDPQTEFEMKEYSVYDK